MRNTKEFRDLVESYAKLNQLDEVGGNSVNIQLNVPMTVEEAHKTIQADPILTQVVDEPEEE